MKLKSRLLLICTLVFSLFISAFPSGADAVSAEYARLEAIASARGGARVVVRMDVPNIEGLTAMSNHFRTGSEDVSHIQGAMDADLALEDAISMTLDGILFRLNGMDYVVNRRFATIPYVGLTVGSVALAALRGMPEVVSVVEDRLVRVPRMPETDVAAAGVGLDGAMLGQSTRAVGADAAWGFGYDGSGWYVAILDTGILRSHEMFQGKRILEQCFSLGENWYDKTNGGCPNGGIEMSGVGSAAPYDYRMYHGTHVAGIAAGNNRDDRFGVARGANIIAVQVFSYFSDEDDVLSWSTDQVKGLEYLYTLRNTYKIASANMSLGAEKHQTHCDDDSRRAAIDNLRAVGIATVVASGNDGYCNAVSSPACVDSAVSVGAVTKQGDAWRWGNWHDGMVPLLAPGSSITSAISHGDESYGASSGTSMAAPHVAGAWAIMKQFNENLSIDDILAIFRQSGQMVASGFCAGSSQIPSLNVGHAIMSLLTIAPPVNLSANQHANKSLLQTEYINELTWGANPANSGKNITGYRVYLSEGGGLKLLSEVGGSVYGYFHRNVEERRELTYAVTTLDGEGNESMPVYHTMDFGISQ